MKGNREKEEDNPESQEFKEKEQKLKNCPIRKENSLRTPEIPTIAWANSNFRTFPNNIHFYSLDVGEDNGLKLNPNSRIWNSRIVHGQLPKSQN